MASASLAPNPRRWFNNLSALVVDNPIIERELKVRVRFARAFWLQGAYLFLLTAIVTAAYQGIVARNPLSNPAELQQRLQGFYWMLLYSLITLVVLIAPALTAGALSFEKERRTLDLLLASPLRPSAILSGKLIASFAFVLLLLILSMPIVTVCVLLGGATLGDVLATYVMIAFDVLHLSAFALYCSACNRSSGTATFWAYLGTALLLAASAPFAVASVGTLLAPMFVPGASRSLVPMPLVSLHPFITPLIKTLPTKVLGVEVPCWIVTVVGSLVLTRFWLTGAGARLTNEGNPLGSLRRQGLFLTLLVAAGLSGMYSTYTGIVGGGPHGSSVVDFVFLMSICVLFIAISLFLPWIATFGEHEDRPPADDGWFRPLRMFRPVASGALPYLLTWYGSAVLVVLALLRRTPHFKISVEVAAAAVFYFGAILSLFWAIGRLWSVITRSLNQARLLTIATILLTMVLPGPSKVSYFYPIAHSMGNWNPSSGIPIDYEFIYQVAVRGTIMGIVAYLLTVICRGISGRRKCAAGAGGS